MNPVYSDPIPLREKRFKDKKNCKEIWILFICFLLVVEQGSYPKTILSIL